MGPLGLVVMASEEGPDAFGVVFLATLSGPFGASEVFLLSVQEERSRPRVENMYKVLFTVSAN